MASSLRLPFALTKAAAADLTRKGTPLSRRNLLNRQLLPTAAKLGLKGINWHWMRRANVTLHDSVGTPLGTVQEVVGHSSPEITRDICLHSVPADAKQAMKKVEEVKSDANGPKICRQQNRPLG